MDRQISFAIMSVAVYSSRIEIYPPAPECIKVPNMPQVKTSHCFVDVKNIYILIEIIILHHLSVVFLVRLLALSSAK